MLINISFMCTVTVGIVLCLEGFEEKDGRLVKGRGSLWW